MKGIEVVASTDSFAEIVSGGGFSVYSPRPTWQETVRDALVSHRTVSRFVLLCLRWLGLWSVLDGGR